MNDKTDSLMIDMIARIGENAEALEAVANYSQDLGRGSPAIAGVVARDLRHLAEEMENRQREVLLEERQEKPSPAE